MSTCYEEVIGVRDDLFEEISDYLYEINYKKSKIQALLANSLILPGSIITYPVNNIKLTYGSNPSEVYGKTLSQILLSLREENKKLNVQDLFHITKELILIQVVLCRHNIRVYSLHPEEVYMNTKTGSIRFELISKNHLQQSFLDYQEELELGFGEIGYVSSNTLVAHIYVRVPEYVLSAFSVRQLQKVLTALLENSILQNQENYVFKKLYGMLMLQDNNITMSQLLLKQNLLEELFDDEYQLHENAHMLLDRLQGSAHYIHQLINPFQNLNKFVQRQLRYLLGEKSVRTLFELVLYDNNCQTQVHNEFMTFYEEYIAKMSFMNDSIDHELSELATVSSEERTYSCLSPLDDKIIIVTQPSQQTQLIEQLILDFFINNQYENDVIIFNISKIERFIEQLLSYVNGNKENTILDESTDPQSILFEYYSKQGNVLPTKRQRTLSPQLEDIYRMSFENYQDENRASFTGQYEQFSKQLAKCAQYLGQVYPEFLQLLDVQPDNELQIFDCLTAGVNLLMLTRMLIKPEIKINFIIDEEQVMQAKSSIDANIMYSMIVSLNNEVVSNCQILYFKSKSLECDEKNKIQKQFEHYLNSTKIQRINIEIQDYLSDRKSMLSMLNDDEEQNSYINGFITNQICEQNQFVCYAGQIGMWILNSGIFESFSEDDLNRGTAEGLKLPSRIEQLFVEAKKQTKKILEVSVDYFLMNGNCAHKQQQVITQCCRCHSNENLRVQKVLLFFCALLTRDIDTEFAVDLLELTQEQAQNGLITLCGYRMLSQPTQDRYIITDLELAKHVLHYASGYELAYVSSRVFSHLVERYQLSRSVDNTGGLPFMHDLNSEIWRIFKCYDMLDKVSMEIPSYRLSKNRHVSIDPTVGEDSSRKNIVYMEEHSSYTLSEIDMALVQNRELLNSIAEADSSEGSFGGYFDAVEARPHTNFEQTTKKDQLRSDIMKVDELLLRIKVAIILIGSIQENSTNIDFREKSEGKVVFISNYGPYIWYIVQRTRQLLETLRLIVEENPMMISYIKVYDKLSLQLKWHQFMNVPLGKQAGLIDTLIEDNTTNLWSLTVSWRLLKSGYTSETIQYCLLNIRSVLPLNHLRDLYDTIQQLGIYKAAACEGFIDLYTIATQYYTHVIATEKIYEYDGSEPYSEAILLCEVLICACREEQNECLLYAVCFMCLQFYKQFGHNKVLQVMLLNSLGYLQGIYEVMWRTQSGDTHFSYSSFIYQVIERYFNTVMLRTLEELDDESAVRTQKHWQSLFKYEDEFVELVTSKSCTGSDEYEALVSMLLKCYSLSMINEVLLWAAFKCDEQTIDQFLYIFYAPSVDSSLSRYLLLNRVVYDDNTQLWLTIILYEVIQYIRCDQIIQEIDQLQLEVELLTRTSQSIKQAQLCNILASLLECIKKLPYCQLTFLNHVNEVNYDQTYEILSKMYTDKELKYTVSIILVIHYLIAVYSGDLQAMCFLKEELRSYVPSRDSHLTFISSLVEEVFEADHRMIQQYIADGNYLMLGLCLYSAQHIREVRYSILQSGNKQLRENLLDGNQASLVIRLLNRHEFRDGVCTVRFKYIQERKVQEEDNCYGFIEYWSD